MPQLALNLFARSLKDVHSNRRLVSITQLHGSFADLLDFFRGQKPQSVNQYEIRHGFDFSRAAS